LNNQVSLVVQNFINYRLNASFGLQRLKYPQPMKILINYDGRILSSI